MGLVDGVISSVGTVLVFHQLKTGSDSEKQQENIQEAQFILQYNQTFIQDENMSFVEHELEKSLLGKNSEPIISEDNKQKFINYLVYLEGLAPLLLNEVLKLEHVDDLFAYRYFLTVNNKELQETELFEFPDYYRGCFKLYDQWKDYRRAKKLEILQDDNSLDAWLHFEEHIDSCNSVRSMNATDDLKKIAALIYNTDPYIYPAAFGDMKIAKKVIPKLIQQKISIFNPENIYVCTTNDEISAMALILTENSFQNMSTEIPKKLLKQLPNSFMNVYNDYFSKLMVDYSKTSKSIYIACLSANPAYREYHSGRYLLKHLINKLPGENLSLHVLKDNEKAIRLYKKCGFNRKEEQTGYAYNKTPPTCIEMTRTGNTNLI